MSFWVVSGYQSGSDLVRVKTSKGHQPERILEANFSKIAFFVFSQMRPFQNDGILSAVAALILTGARDKQPELMCSGQ